MSVLKESKITRFIFNEGIRLDPPLHKKQGFEVEVIEVDLVVSTIWRLKSAHRRIDKCFCHCVGIGCELFAVRAHHLHKEPFKVPL